MLKDQLIELHHLCNKEKDFKDKLKELKSEFSDHKDNIAELKMQVIEGMKTIKHKYAKYKNMEIFLVTKSRKKKPSKEDLSDLVQEILELDITKEEKTEKILEAMKPKHQNTCDDILTIKFTK
nr:MAG: hypothetical protein DiTV3a_F6ORF4 [Diabrotica toursvirus 3a]